VNPTGIETFDRILQGGIPSGHVVLLAGNSGTGKTTLSMEWLFAGHKEHGENGLYLTLTEPVTQAANNLEKFSFYDEAAFNDGIHFTDMRSMMDLIGTGKKNVESDNLTEADLEEILSAIEEIVIETDADRVVLDSITALAYMFDEKRLVRYFIFRLGALLDNLDCTTFLTSEVSGDGYSVYNVEEFIADGIIQMTQRDVQNDLQRMLQIIKLRGQDYVSESVPFTITAAEWWMTMG